MSESEHNKKCCTGEEFTGEGTSLLSRILPMLDPVKAPIDPYSIQDILVFASRYAELVRFYEMEDNITCVQYEDDEAAKPLYNDKTSETKLPVQQYKKQPSQNTKPAETTWRDFFTKDIAVLVAVISQYGKKIWGIKDEYNSLRKKAEADTDLNTRIKNYKKIFYYILDHIRHIRSWYQLTVNGHPLQKELEVKIRSFLSPALIKLIAYDKGLKASLQEDLDLLSEYEEFKTDLWKADYEEIKYDSTIYVGDDDHEKIINALLYIDDIFNTIIKVYNETIERSDYYWQQAIESYPTHQPHMALFIAFIELFAYAKKDLNDLTRKHLDFFYRDVLHLKEKPASPDSVYLIYQLAKGVDDFLLKKETQLSGGKDGLGKQLIYTPDSELVINKAKVADLKTIFLDNGSSIENIYAAPVANSADGKGEKFKEAETAWSTFGYFEPRNNADKITGEKANLGFAIASPHLELGKSDRTINIDIYFKANDEQAKIISGLKNDDYDIYFTGKKDWIQPIDDPELQELQFSDAKVLVSKNLFLRSFNFLKTPAVVLKDVHKLDSSIADKIGDVKNKTDFFDKIKTITAAESKDVVSFSGNKTFHAPLPSISVPAERSIRFTAIIEPQQEAITSPGKDFKDLSLKSKYPVCKIIFKPKQYENFKNVLITGIKISVDVKGLKDIVIENDNGILDPQKPFFPFTARPVHGSSFYLGAKEFENKEINTLTANIEWMGNLDLKNRYLGYVNFRPLPKQILTSLDKSIIAKEVTGTPKTENIAEVDPSIKFFEGDTLKTSLCSSGFPANNKYTSYTNYKGKRLIFHNGQWIEDDTNGQGVINLFDQDPDVSGLTQWELIKDKEPIAQAKESNNWKIVCMTLGQDFGHELYPTLVAQFLAKKKRIQSEGTGENEVFCVVDAAQGDDIFIPSTPADVQIKSISIDYKADKIIKTTDGQFFHVYPFGVVETFPDSFYTKENDLEKFKQLLNVEKKSDQLIVPTNYLLPQFKFGGSPALTPVIKNLNLTASDPLFEFKSKNYLRLNQYLSADEQQGNLYIGIEDLVPPQNLSLLFKFADGTAYDNDSLPPPIHWSYLVNNEWVPLPADHLISDSTYGFQTTGIVLIDFPPDATNNNTMFDKEGLHWLCASIEKNSDRIPKLIDVIAQANQATFLDQQNDPAHYKIPLPAKTISKPLVKIPEIKVIDQPFESFDGKPGEEGKQFYRRVSERLRHKGRAITAKDYELLILEQFPFIYKVKVLAHTDPDCLCRKHKNETTQKNDCCCPQVAPGHVLIVPISNLRNRNAIDKLKPRTGRRTLIKIEEYLRKRVSSFVHVHARNPKFEEVKVSFNVKLRAGADRGYYLRKLNQDIIQYLTPWAFDSSFEILFGNKIYASKIIDFIEDQKYVDYITCFRMIHIAEGCCDDDTLKDMNCDEMNVDVSELQDKLSDLKKSSENLKQRTDKLKAELQKQPDPAKQKELDGLQDEQFSFKERIKGIESSLNRFLSEVSATSSQAILVSAKQHCITVIEEDPEEDICNCKDEKTIKEETNKEQPHAHPEIPKPVTSETPKPATPEASKPATPKEPSIGEQPHLPKDPVKEIPTIETGKIPPKEPSTGEQPHVLKDPLKDIPIIETGKITPKKPGTKTGPTKPGTKKNP